MLKKLCIGAICAVAMGCATAKVDAHPPGYGFGWRQPAYVPAPYPVAPIVVNQNYWSNYRYNYNLNQDYYPRPYGVQPYQFTPYRPYSYLNEGLHYRGSFNYSFDYRR